MLRDSLTAAKEQQTYTASKMSIDHIDIFLRNTFEMRLFI